MSRSMRRCVLLVLLALSGATGVLADSVVPLTIGVRQTAADASPTAVANVRVQLGVRHAATDSEGNATLLGVPDGRYTLSIRQPGFNRLSQVLDVGPGNRESTLVTLVPAQRVHWRGRVLVTPDGAPLAGARIELVPLDVQAALSGVAHSLSDLEGLFAFVDLPVGRYRLTAEAPGFAPYRRDVEVAAEQPDDAAVFDPPLLDGVALDMCREWGSNCQKPAADRFCQLHDYDEAAEFKVEHDKPPTRVISSGKLCEGASCDRIVWIRCRARLTADQNIELQPIETSLDQAFVVRDAVSGKPLAGAGLRLFETWPDAAIAEARTDGAGRGRLSGLRLGDFNAAKADGSVVRSRRRVTLHVEAEGYVSRVLPLWLGREAATLDIALTPLAVVPEVEPNDDRERAQAVPVGVPVEMRIGQLGDHDVFVIDLQEAADLRLRLTTDPPIQTYLQLFDGEGSLLRRRSAYANQENVIDLGVGPGRYHVDVSEWGDNAFDPDARVTLTIDAVPAVDPSEPNDTPESATTVVLNQQVSGLAWPTGDIDFYRLDVDRHGILRIEDHHKTLQRMLLLRAANGDLLAKQGRYANQPLALEHAVTPGVYYLELHEWGDDAASLEPYRFNVRLLPDDGMLNPPAEGGVLRASRALESHSWFATTLLPRGDRDIFSVDVPGAGVMRMQSLGPMQRHIQVYDAAGKLLGKKGVYANVPLDFAWHVEGPQTVFLVMEEWGNDAYSLLPYSMRFWFERADEVDYQQRNESFAQATPLLPGDRVQGSFLPLRDKDVYAIDVDFPGVLQVESRSAQQTHIALYDAHQSLLFKKGVYAKVPLSFDFEVLAGRYFLVTEEWGNDRGSTEPYDLKVRLDRAEPSERVPLDAEPLRLLRLGEAQSFTIDHKADRDRFVFDAAAAGEYQVSVASALQTEVRVFDAASGTLLGEARGYAPFRKHVPVTLEAPARLRIEVNEWGRDARGAVPGFVMVDDRVRPIQAAAIEAVPVADDPTRVAFSMQALKHVDAAGECQIDLDGDGAADVRLTETGPQFGRFVRAGVHRVEAHCSGSDGVSSRQHFWVQATGQRALTGIELSLAAPFEGQVVDAELTLSAQAVSYSGRPVSSVAFELDGVSVATDYTSPFEAQVNWRRLVPGDHRLRVVARDAAGNEAVVSRGFQLSEYFGLSPPDGAVLSGERVRISWTAPEHGASRLRFRKQGAEQWQQARGESGRVRVVELDGLEARVPYEIQPLGGAEPGPVRTLTRVKGLAFSRPRYGANVQRDYDQRVGIGVRNNGDRPLQVRLECGTPRDPDLLVSFVGEGSEDAPIPLAPGEYRQFHLAISAQDVDTPDHSVPVRIVADNGLSDEAEVAVHVRLPHVELEWQDLGPLPLGHGHRLRLVNRGDTVTDLRVEAATANAVDISPTIQHGLLKSGAAQEFVVSPRFHEEFRGVATRIVAHALDRRSEHDYTLQLAPGERVRRLWLFPGLDPSAADTIAREPALIANAERAAVLDPAGIDWSRRDNPEDSDGDGRSDRWSTVVDDVRWVGDDTVGDNEIDFVHADVGDDGIFEYSAYREGDGWRATNLVEAWLEMGFTLPWSRSSYHPHNTDIVLNGRVIGRLEDVIPEGNFSFRIPPDALRFDDNGMPGENEIGINSRHLRGGHYVVNSDFRFKYRLTATPVWTVASSGGEAREALTALNGVAIDAPDLSISTSELWLDAPLKTKAGDPVAVEIPVRNLGASSVAQAVLALQRRGAGGVEELARVNVDDIRLQGSSRARIAWTATPGPGEYTLEIDPDQSLEDIDRANNKAHFFLEVKGEEIPLRVRFDSPSPDTVSERVRNELRAGVEGDARIARAELSIDGGLWNELPVNDGATVAAPLLLQPGSHRLTLRVTDAAGNQASESLQTTVRVEAGDARIVQPQAGQKISERHVHVALQVPAETRLAGVRSAGGPWHRAVVVGDQAHAELPLRFGRQSIEAMVVSADGVAQLLQVEVEATTQPRADAERVVTGASEQGLFWPAADSELALDMFQAFNGVLRPVARPREASLGDSSRPANVRAMDPQMRRRYEMAKRLRAEGAALQQQGRLAAAVGKYRESLRLYPDYRLEAHIRRIEQVLGASAVRTR